MIDMAKAKIDLKNGGRFFLAKNQAFVAKFIAENKLVPIPRAELTAKSAKFSLSDLVPIWQKYGGMLMPHLHFGDNVYLLNDSQWKKISGAIVQDLTERLGKTKAISFAAAANLSKAIEEIG